jgi:hypothetical protein
MRPWSYRREVIVGDPTPPPVVINNTIEKSKPVTLRGILAAFVICSTALVLGLWWLGVRLPGASAAPLPPPIALIQSLSDLATTKVHITDSIELENNHYIGRWSLHGEVVLGVDLSAVRYVKVDEVAKRATLRLPRPHQISSKVDHERSEEVFIKWKSLFPTSDKQILRDEVWKQADRKIQRLGQEVGYIERAKVQAERVLGQLLEGAGWKADFEWQ